MDQQVSDFDYELPTELIAQEPLADRAGSRMLVISRERQSFRDDLFRNFASYIRPGDCLVLNNSRVFPARLHGHRHSATGAEVEVFLIRPVPERDRAWQALVRPGKRVRTGDNIVLSDRSTLTILEQGAFGERVVHFGGSDPVDAIVDRAGDVPLPPYIDRPPTDEDAQRYQTVFARERGSAAAPTAGLHFTSEMLEQCRAAGATIAHLTLHVGLGTFAPLRAENVADIHLHSERFAISESDAKILQSATRRFCVGTTSVRCLESSLLSDTFGPISGDTNLFIHPGFQFRGTGAMLTNFHLPKSSLLMLVSAFAGTELALRAYRHAVNEKYRFFSYGDCMLIE